MKNILPILFMCFTLCASGQNWQWADSYADTSNDNTLSKFVICDVYGNVYVAGSSGNVLADYIFLLKYDSVGNLLGSKKIGNDDGDKPASLTTDAYGNIYLVGNILDDSIVFSTATVHNPAGMPNFIIVKYDPYGNEVWVRSTDGIGATNVYGAATDAVGNTFVTGGFYSHAITIGTTTLDSAFCNFYLAKYDSSGNVLWAKNAVGDGSFASATAITCDHDGNIYLTGQLTNPAVTFGTTILNGAKIYLAKYDSAGNVLWAKNFGGGGATPNSLCTDAMSNGYLVGQFDSATVTLGAFILTNSGSIGTNDLFIAKYDSSGNVLWGNSAGGAGNDEANSVSADATGNVYLTGSFESHALTFGADTVFNSDSLAFNLFVAKYNNTGTALWGIGSANSGSYQNAGASAITAVDNGSGMGGVFVTGWYVSDTILFGATLLQDSLLGSPPPNEMFIAKVNATTSIKSITPPLTNISLFPNPNNGNMNVVLHEPLLIDMEVYDCLGRMYYKITLTGAEKTIEINIQNMPPGEYFLHATGSCYSECIPFIISR